MDNSTNNQNSFVNPDADGVNSKAHQKRIREFMQNSITDESDSNDDSDWFDAFDDDALEDEQVKTPEKLDNKDTETEPQPSVIKETSLDNDQAAVSIKIEDSEEIEVDFLEDDLLDIDDTSLNNTDALNTENTDSLESTDNLNNVAQPDSSNHVNDVDNLNDSKLTSSQSLDSQSVETAQTGNEPQTDKRTHSSDKLPDSQSTNPITQQAVDAPVNVTDAHINTDINAHINNAPSNQALDPALDSQIDNAVVEMPNHSIQPSIQPQVVQPASDNVNYPAHDNVKENTQTATTHDAQIATDTAGNELGEITDEQINDKEIHPKLNEQEKIDESAEKIFAQLMQDETITTEYSPPSEPKTEAKTDDSIAETPDTDEFRAVFIHSQGLTGDESNQDTSTNQLADNTADKTMGSDSAIKSSLTAKPSSTSDTNTSRDTSIQDKSSISDTSGDISNSRPTSMDTAKNNNLFNDTQSTHTGEAQKNSTKAAIRQLKHANLANQKNFLAEDASVSIFDRLLYALMTGLGLGFVGLLIDLLVTILRSIMGMGNGNMIWLFTPVMALMGMVFGFISGREAGSDGMQLINFSGKEASNNASLSGEFYRGVGVAIFIASLAWIAMMLFA